MLLRLLLDPTAIPRAVWPHRGLLLQWTRRLLAMRYTGSFLGPFWNLATPLFMLAVYTFVFSIVFQARWQMLDPELDATRGYAVILFCGMAMFQIFSETVAAGSRCIVDNANLVKKVIFPLELLPLAQMLAATVTGLIWFALVLCAAVCSGIGISATVLLFPLALLPLMAFSAGIGWFVAATTVYLRDIPLLAGMLLQALFFMTPIFYPASLVPASLAWLLDINPLAWLCGLCRDILLFNMVPPWRHLAGVWLFCGLVCQLGFVWFVKVKKGFADVI